MKETTIIFDAIALIFLSLGSLFKVLHWPGGNVLLLLSLGFLIPIAIILTAIYLYRKK